MNKDIIFAPVITEKAEGLKAQNTYVFKVNPKATKTQLKQIIEKTFNVKVSSINTLNATTKKKRVGKYAGRTNAYKKAYVKLMKGSTIEL